VEAPRVLKDLVYPTHGDLLQLRFRKREWITAFVPDDEVFGLARELVLQRIYDRFNTGNDRLVVDTRAQVGLFSLIAAQRAARVAALGPNLINFGVPGGTGGSTTLATSPRWRPLCGRRAGPGRSKLAQHGGCDRRDGRLHRHGDVAGRAGVDARRDDPLKLEIEGAEFEVLGASGA
jgi:hypothetical protein